MKSATGASTGTTAGDGAVTAHVAGASGDAMHLTTNADALTTVGAHHNGWQQDV